MVAKGSVVTVADILRRLMARAPMQDAQLLFLLAELDAGRLTTVQIAGLLTALHCLTAGL